MNFLSVMGPRNALGRPPGQSSRSGTRYIKAAEVPLGTGRHEGKPGKIGPVDCPEAVAPLCFRAPAMWFNMLKLDLTQFFNPL